MNSSEPQSPLTVDPSILIGPPTGQAHACGSANYLLTGLVVAGPLTITIYITWWFITWVDGWVKPLVPAAYLPETYLPFRDPGLRPRHRAHRPHPPRLPDRKPRRQDAPEPWRGRLEPHAGGARHLQGHEAGLRDDLLRERHVLPQGRSRRVPGEGHLVARLHLDAGQPRPGGSVADPPGNISAYSCPARPTRRRASSSICRARA